MAIRLSDSDDLAANADINITPFIDVMLVLLIIFMVAAPLSTVDVPVELPIASATAAARPTEPVFVTLHADLSVSVVERVITLADLPSELEIVSGMKRDTRIYLLADRAVPYGEVMAMMNRMRGTGYLKIGLVGLEETAPSETAAPAESPTP
jgi:biopolymer transport protein ExbD